MIRQIVTGGLGLAMLFLASGCSPTVKVAPPDKPIVINMNIKIEHDIRVKMDRDVENLINKENGLF